MGLYQQRPCQFELKEAKNTEWNEGRLSDFLNLAGWDNNGTLLQTRVILQEKGRISPKAFQKSLGLPP
jgi:hypothetical protein